MDRGNAIVRERALRDAVLAGDAAAWRPGTTSTLPALLRM